MKQLLIIMVLLYTVSCKETGSEKLEREYKEQKAKNDAIRDSLDLEIIKLGGKP